MTSVSLMEWNGKPQLQWDWENLMMFNAATTENPKKLQPTGWDVDGERGFDSGSLYSSGSASGAGSGRGGSGSDLGLASFSKSSKSASNNSSSTGEVKTSNFGFEASEAILEDSGGRKQVAKAKPIGASPTLEASVGSGEPLLGLKLGKRMYFEDACAGSNAKTASFSVNPVSAVNTPKKSKSSSQSVLAPHCQVEGCNLDLSSAKDYHRKHRVCENHSKCPKVIVAGLERRFCQQCSRFHALSEFDEKKRSCRRRLSDHNARRRKPQPEPLQLSTARLSSSLYGAADERQQMSLIWNRAPVDHSRLNPNSTWEDTSGSKFTITKEYILKPSKVGGTQQQLHLPRNEVTNLSPIHCHDSNGFLTSKTKGTTANVLNQGMEESVISSNVDATQDLHRALSLLSNNNTWGSCEQKSVSLEQPMSTNHSSIPQSIVPVIPQGLPIASPDFWRTEHQSIDSKVHTLASHNNDSNYFQEFQLSRGPYEGDFYSSQLN